MHAIPEADRQAMRAVYFGLIAEVDAQVGRIIAALEATGQYDDTLIVFTSDHGEMLGDHWCWGKGGWFEASNHIPLIIRDPGAPAIGRGHRVAAFTDSVDLVPTILAWLGQPVPAECNGHALQPWLGGETPASWRQSTFWEFDFRGPVSLHFERALGLSSDQCVLNVIRDDDFKYVHFVGLPPLLYDLRSDPGELTDRAADPAMAPIVADRARRLLTHRMLHAERTLANAMLTSRGVHYADPPRG